MRFLTSKADRPYSQGMHSLFCGYRLSLPWLRMPLVSSSDLLKALQLTNPRAVALPYAYLDRNVPRRAVYAKAWDEVKAA